MICKCCGGSGKYRQPNNPDKFDELVDVELEKGYFVNEVMAREKAYKRVGFTVVDCPFCKKKEE